MIRTLAAILALIPAAALAHHGWSSYDATKTVTLTAPLTKLRWANPHGTAQVMRDGRPWRVVLAPVARMEARGLDRKLLTPRTPVTLVGYPRTDGTAEMRIERVTIAGKTVELR